MADTPPPKHDEGLVYDLRTLVSHGHTSRRTLLGLLAGTGATAVLAACAPTSTTTSATSAAGAGAASSTPSATAAATAATAATATASASATSSADAAVTSAYADCGLEIPDETAGPYPGDGSNGPNVLVESGIVRQDLTTSFGSANGSVAGVPLEVTLTLLDSSTGCAPMAGAAVYLWHCDATGNYSLYSSGAEDQNWLRGVQEADANGQVTFTTIFPGAYAGRYPHIHFEVFESLANTTSSGQVLKVSQLALPAAACEAVYAGAGYGNSARNFAQTPITRDNVFGDDGGIYQLATTSGSASAGYAAALNVTL